MSGKKPSLGRGLAELSPRCSRAAPGMPEAEKPPILAGDRLASLAGRSVAAGQVSAARRYAPGILGRSGRLHQIARPGAAHPGAPAAAAFAGESQRYEIIAGERRWRAAQMAGLAEIPAVIRDVPDEDAVAMALIENIQREDLNPLEEARALLRLIEEFGLTHQAAAEAVGRSRAAVSNLLRLMELTDEVKEMLEQPPDRNGPCARAAGARPRAGNRSKSPPWSPKSPCRCATRKALVRRIMNPKQAAAAAPAAAPDPDIHRLETEIAEKLGAKVAFQHAASGKGKLIVSYNSLDELEGILAHIQ